MTERPKVDEDWLARRLAMNAGIDWDKLANYPGYSRYYWREQAELMRATFAEDLALEAAVAARR